MDVVLALDVQKVDTARDILGRCKGYFSCVKIGHVILSAIDVSLIREICASLPVFLDLKFHDIPNTVEKAISGYFKVFPNMKFFTIHGTAHSDVLKVAKDTTPATPLSVITLSSDDINIDNSLRIVERNLEAGINSFICPPYLIKEIRKIFGKDMILVVPGIRNDVEKDDHRDSLTAAEAYGHGADYIVVGRPILNSDNPKETIKRYLR